MPVPGPAATAEAARQLAARALLAPSSLSAADARQLSGLLAAPSAWPLAATALAAVLAARPDLVRPRHLEEMVAGLAEASVVAGRTPEDARAAADAVVAVLGAAIDGGLAPAAAALVASLYRERYGLLSDRRLDLLRQAEAWAPQLLPPSELIATLPRAATQIERERLVGEVLGRRLLAEPAAAVPEAMTQISAVADGPAWRTVRALLALDPRLPEATRDLLGRPAAPLHAALGRALARGPLLVVHNVRIGQGDELIRIGPLLQGILAAFPGAEVVVATPRPYLWEHPRVRALPIAAAAEELAAGELGGLFELVEPRVPEVNLVPEVRAAAARRLEDDPPLFALRADVGANHFVFASLVADGEEWVGRLGVDRLYSRHVYDATRRLLAALGLPWLPVAAAPARRDANPLTGLPSADALAVWNRLLPAGEGPVAMVQPFGGAGAIKGLDPEDPERLAAELAALVAEGYRAVLLPPGTQWVPPGRLAGLPEILGDAAARVAIAPDPGDPSAARRWPLEERPDLPWADRVMRLFKHFLPRADLVVTIEGWMGHAAAQLGTPVRLVSAGGSYEVDWHPPGAVEHRTTLSPLAAQPTVDLSAAAPPPRPRLLGRHLLVTVLPEIGAAGEAAIGGLGHALASPDPRVRAAAARGMAAGLPGGPARRALHRMLDDPEPEVRLAAAESLLAEGSATASGPSRATLRAHRAVARQDWPEIVTLGAAALPALAVAARGDNDVVRREARWMMERLLAQRPRSRAR